MWRRPNNTSTASARPCSLFPSPHPVPLTDTHLCPAPPVDRPVATSTWGGQESTCHPPSRVPHFHAPLHCPHRSSSPSISAKIRVSTYSSASHPTKHTHTHKHKHKHTHTHTHTHTGLETFLEEARRMKERYAVRHIFLSTDCDDTARACAVCPLCFRLGLDSWFRFWVQAAMTRLARAMPRSG